MSSPALWCSILDARRCWTVTGPKAFSSVRAVHRENDILAIQSPTQSPTRLAFLWFFSLLTIRLPLSCILGFARTLAQSYDYVIIASVSFIMSATATGLLRADRALVFTLGLSVSRETGRPPQANLYTYLHLVTFELEDEKQRDRH